MAGQLLAMVIVHQIRGHTHVFPGQADELYLPMEYRQGSMHAGYQNPMHQHTWLFPLLICQKD